MTLSPKKCASNFTGSTTSGGVEAKEVEIANTRLDGVTSPTGDGARDLQAADRSGSYLQVLVRKHRRTDRGEDARPGAPGARLPLASSPLATDAAVPPVFGLPQPMLLAYSTAAPARWGDLKAPGTGGAPAVAGRTAGRELRAAPGPDGDGFEKKPRGLLWGVLESLDDLEPQAGDAGPERVEVYRFERAGGEYLAAGGSRDTVLERAARRVARVPAALLAELLAVPRLLLALAAAPLVAVERCALRAARAALQPAVQTAADQALKPALALLFNGVVQPPLVFIGNVLRASREALRPAWLALGDALEPAARLLRALRLVHVHVQHAPCRCTRSPSATL